MKRIPRFLPKRVRYFPRPLTINPHESKTIDLATGAGREIVRLPHRFKSSHERYDAEKITRVKEAIDYIDKHATKK